MLESLIEYVRDSFVEVLEIGIVVVMKGWCKVGRRRKKEDDCTCT
jgi:hypothetical protein